MENFHFDHWVEKILNGELSWATNTYTAYLVTSGYMPVKSNPSMLADIPASAILAYTPVENRTVSGRYMKADDLTFTGVTDATSVHAVVIVASDGTLSHYITSIAGLGVSADNMSLNLLWADCGISAL